MDKSFGDSAACYTGVESWTVRCLELDLTLNTLSEAQVCVSCLRQCPQTVLCPAQKTLHRKFCEKCSIS